MFCNVVLLFLLVVSTLGDPSVYYDSADAEQHFADFIKKYDRNYESDEYSKRFEIFKERLEKINQWNDIYEASFVVNQFTDQDLSKSNSCRESRRGVNITKQVFVKQEWLENVPESLDYRQNGFVTEVKDQMQCESCYIFSAVGNIEARYAMRTGHLISLSEQQALDCVGNPCNTGGYEDKVIRDLMYEKGLMKEVDYPYEGQRGYCHVKERRVAVRVTDEFNIPTPNDQTLKAALAHYGPLSVAFFAPQSISHIFSHKIIAPQDCYPGQQPNHAVVLVGYSTDAYGRPYWIIKNSWGQNWGNDGYLHLEMGYCSILITGAACAEVQSA